METKNESTTETKLEQEAPKQEGSKLCTVGKVIGGVALAAVAVFGAFKAFQAFGGDINVTLPTDSVPTEASWS